MFGPQPMYYQQPPTYQQPAPHMYVQQPVYAGRRRACDDCGCCDTLCGLLACCCLVDLCLDATM